MREEKKLSGQTCGQTESHTRLLTEQERAGLASEIPDWKAGDKSMEREFSFRDFREAMHFVNKVAANAEKQDHHPDICVFYNRVRLTLSTHKAGGLTMNDFIMAAKIDQILSPQMAAH
ncbi:MAG: 4a-hydroxytetrahydrobiopterin dehydratase [Nitrospiraceae bacterium]|nr:4a-hydroxytetrahydrobiopterin dehydratase [Nitrospiraceae bacterium]